HFYGDTLTVEYPTGSGKLLNLLEISRAVGRRLVSLMLTDSTGRRPSTAANPLYNDPSWHNLVPFYEFFNGDTGQGLGASHQTGWTTLVAPLMYDLCQR